MTGKIKEVFPGGNTSRGFVSYYDYIIPPDACRIMVIKGGPGVGKSTFMKKIAVHMLDRGFDVEFHHCSSDNNSLDGIVIPKIRVAMIDGTSPHVVDPKNPGAVDEIIHLGDYWNEAGIRQHKQEILAINQKVGKSFQRAYRFLNAAKVIHGDMELLIGAGVDFALANKITAELYGQIFEGYSIGEKVGFCRKLFGSAITPKGFAHHLETILAPFSRVWMVTGEAGSGKSTLITKLANAAVERGLDCEAYFCAFDPDKMEHLIIPELNVAVTTGVEPHCAEVPKEKVTVIDMNKCLNSDYLSETRSLIEADKKIVENLFAEAINCISQAKAAHDQMEQYYIPYMDFGAISELGERILARILNYAAEQC